RDVEYGTANGKQLLLDAYVPAVGSDRRPAVIMLHGGGWRVGDKATWGEEAQRLAARGWVAFSVNYRLDEPSAFPAEIDDAQAAVRWVRDHADEYLVDRRRVAALGESAGGHLAAMLATLGSGSLDEGARIRVGAAWSPPTDLIALAGSRGDGWVGRLVGCTLSTCPDLLAQASPVNHVDGSDAPLYLVHSTDELVPLSQAEAMAQRLRTAGVDHRLDVFPGSRHALDFRADAWAPTLAFLERHLAPEAQAERTDDTSSPAAPNENSPVVFQAAAVAVLAAGGAVMLRRRRRRREP
ncbi:MAG TPA: alpha/beta hydrolase, partial [Acidimicrobiales bacterium]|nr:alpha/beta hydrolase [Acidimicrobiales bacterium]